MPFTCQSGLRSVDPGRSRCRFLDAQLRCEQRMSCRAAVASHALHHGLRGCRADLIRELVNSSQCRNRGIAVVEIVEAHKRDVFRTTQSGLAQRGKLDNTPDVVAFAETLERVVVETVESGKMTKDLALLVGEGTPFLTTQEFLAALDENLQSAMAAS